MRKIASIVLASLLGISFTPVAALAEDNPVQSADNVLVPLKVSDHCVSKKEFKKIKTGMTQKKVKAITGTGGTVIAESEFGGYRTVIRDYRTCARYASVNVTFQNGVVISKAGFWL